MLGRSLLSLTVLAMAVWPASASDDRKELTAFVGYRGGGSFENFTTGQEFDVSSAENYGLSFDFPINDDAKLELLWDRQETEIETHGFGGTNRVPLDISYFHVGALIQPTYDEDVQPFATASIGLTYMSPDAPNTGSDTRFSFSVGGGGKFFFGERIGIRLEGRVYGTFVNSGSSIFCGGGSGGGGCSFGVSGNIVWQLEANAGLIIAF